MRKYSKGYLAFTQGKFDEWAVYVKYPNFPEWPTDKWYFIKLRVYQQYVGKAAYEDFCGLYDKNTPGSDAASAKVSYATKIAQLIKSSKGGSSQYGNFYLGQPLNVNYLGRIEGMPGGSGSAPVNRF